MATAPSPPILVWVPGGGVPVGPISNPPVYSQKGTTQLVAGQSYVDVVFGSLQTTSDWVLVACDVDNTTDFEPLNIWPGIITNRTTAGFRLQLNGMPDSGNYYLHWAVSGVNITPSVASTYLLTGPTSGGLSVASTYTVALPPSTTLNSPVVVTLSDGGGGGAFAPTFVTLATGSPTQTFTYTPASYGSKTISTTNSGSLSNPAGIVLNVFSSTYTLTGPSSGNTGAPSTDFTVALPVGGAVAGTVTVTPHASDGTFTPVTVNLTTGASSGTFTYTPATDGVKTISVTNNGGLTDPGSLTYTASTPVVIEFLDNFTGSGSYTGHTADTGHTWVVLHTGETADHFVGAGRLYMPPVGGPSTDLISSYTPVSADTEATIAISVGTITATPEVGMWLRATVDATNPRGYMGRFVGGATNAWQFYRLDAGMTYVQLGSNVTGSLSDGDVLRFTVSGTGATVTLSIYKNGVLGATVNDTSGNRIVTTGKTGVHLYNSTVYVGGNYAINFICNVTPPTPGPAAHYHSLTVNGAMVPATQTDFPVLVSLTDATLKTVANGGHVQNATGCDIAFSSDAAGTTPLKFVVQKYVPTTGELVAWVKIPSLTSSTVFYLRYGNAANVVDQSDPVNVWIGYSAVYPLEDVSALGTTNYINLSRALNTNTATAVTGKIGVGANLVHASGQFFDLGLAIPGAAADTVSAWVKPASFPVAYNAVVVHNTGAGNYNNELFIKSTGKVAVYAAATGGAVSYDGTGSSTLVAGTWYHLALAYDSVNGLKGYVNGALDGTAPAAGPWFTGSSAMKIGGDPVTASREWDGVIDHVTVAGVARSANWIAIEYNNQNAPGTFLTLGTEV